MIKEIGQFIFELFRIRIFRGDDDFGRLLPYLFQNLVNALVKKIICIGSLFRMFLAVQNGIVDRLEDLKRVCLVVVCTGDRLEEACRTSGMTGRPYLLNFASSVSLSQSIVKDFTYWK